MIQLTLLKTNLMTHKTSIYKFGNALLTYLKDPSQIDYFAVLAFVCMTSIIAFVSGMVYGLTFKGW